MTPFASLKIVVSPDRAKYVLPEWLVPGVVPWPPGFRDEINAWSFGFLGTWNVIPDGQVIHGAALNGAVCMNPRTAAALRAACPEISHV